MDPQANGVDGGPSWPTPIPPPPPPRRSPGRVAGAALCLLLALAAAGVGLAVSGGSAPVGAGARAGSSAAAADVSARAVWRTASADTILPPTIKREGTEVYYRLAVDPSESCGQLPAAFLKALGSAGCARLVQATYLDSTESVVATVGFVVVGGTATQRSTLFQDWTADSYARQYTMMPSTYPVTATLAASFQNSRRVAWKSAISNDGTYIAFAVSGFADARQGPNATAFNLGNEPELQSDSPPVQASDDLSGAIQTGISALYPASSGGQS